MNKYLKFAWLDVLTTKTFFIRISLMIIAFAFFIGLMQHSQTPAISILSAYTVFFVVIPFSVGSKSNLDALYSTLAIKRNTVVIGRHAFVLLSQLSAVALALVMGLLLSVIQNQTFNPAELATSAMVMQIFLSLYVAVMLPIFFKFGTTKARLFMVFPVVIIAAITPLLKRIQNDSQFMESLNGISVFMKHNAGLAILGALVIMLLFHALSAAVSMRIYAKKEF